MLTQETIEQLLNRPLTLAEITNLGLYLDIVYERTAQLLCMNLTNETATRTYDIRNGYRTIFTDAFTGVPVVEINGVVQTSDSYTTRQFDNQNGTWFNSIVLKQHPTRSVDAIVVTAAWGFGDFAPTDLRAFATAIFASVSASLTAVNGTLAVKSKKIEDFTVTYQDAVTYDGLIADNQDVIAKYSLCSQGDIRHGRVYAIC